jgi:diguanylate cyclase (GGDEF)-like protein
MWAVVNMSNNLRKQLKTGILVLIYLIGCSSVIWFLPDGLSRYFVTIEAHSAAKRWQVRVLSLLEDSDKAFATATLSDAEKLALDHFAISSDAFQVTLFDQKGIAFYTSGLVQAPDITDSPFFLHKVSHGKPVQTYESVTVAEIENFDLDHLGENYSSTESRLIITDYIPILHDGKFKGVLETFLDVTDQVNVNKIRITSAAVIVFALISLTILIAWHASRTYQARVAAFNSAQREKERSVLERDLLRSKEVQLLSQLSEWMQSSKSMAELFRITTTILEQLLPESSGSIYIYSNSRDVLEGSCSWNGAEHNTEIAPDDCWGLRRGRAYTYGLDDIHFSCSHNHFDDDNVYFCIPIIAHGDTIGLLHIDLHRTANNAAKIAELFELAQTCAEQISLAIANVRLRDELLSQSIRDPLTGLYNRRHFFDVARNQIAVAERNNKTFALASFDVDHFKKFNDNHGHDAGDMVLRAVAEALLSEFEGNDYAFRVGGEEFSILLDAVTEEGALMRMEKLRKMIENIAVRYGSKQLPRITISAGIAMYPNDGNLPQSLMRSADDALYYAKSAGRNQVVKCSQLKDDKMFDEEDIGALFESSQVS